MELTSINECLRREEADWFILQSYTARGGELALAFSFEGGPREDELFVVRFRNVPLFHLPAILHAPAFFRVAGAEEVRRLVPPVSHDADELSGKEGGYTVVILEDGEGSPYGYYIAAEAVAAAWVKEGVI